MAHDKEYFRIRHKKNYPRLREKRLAYEKEYLKRPGVQLRRKLQAQARREKRRLEKLKNGIDYFEHVEDTEKLRALARKWDSEKLQKENNAQLEGFCYHCVQCDCHFLFQEPAIEHSRKLDHGVLRKLRANCLVVNKTIG